MENSNYIYDYIQEHKIQAQYESFHSWKANEIATAMERAVDAAKALTEQLKEHNKLLEERGWHLQDCAEQLKEQNKLLEEQNKLLEEQNSLLEERGWHLQDCASIPVEQAVNESSNERKAEDEEL